MTALAKWRWFGSGAGIELDGGRMVVAAVRLRPRGATVLGVQAIDNFRERPAAAWGSEVLAFLARHGMDRAPLMVVLPPEEAVSRTVSLPGVAGKDLDAALELQIDSLHPYGDGAAATAWTPLSRPGAALAAAARTDVIDRYAALFAEAGLVLGGFTTVPAAIHSALRFRDPAGPFLAAAETEGGSREVRLYGESEAMPLFWGMMDAPFERACALARSQLRLGDGEAIPLGGLLPDGQLSAAAALMAARPGWSRALNLLPAAQRAVVSRWPYVPAAVLAGVLALLTAALAAFPQIEERRLAATLREETARWEQSAVKSRQLEADRQKLLARAGQLNGFRQRTRQDLEALMEATRLIPAPAWAGRLDLTRTTIAIAGEAGQATELLQKFDQSPLFRNSEFVAPLSRSRDSAFDNFQLRAQREERQ